jgi:hypothetical protein
MRELRRAVLLMANAMILSIRELRIKENMMHIRRETAKANGEVRGIYACSACQKHSLIVEVHHVIPVRAMAEMLVDGAELAPNFQVSLCPNCHAYWHALERVQDNETREKLIREMGPFVYHYFLRLTKERDAELERMGIVWSG